MRKGLTYTAIVLGILLCLVSCRRPNTRLPDLRERYGIADTRPFGAFTAYRLLSNIYPDKFINKNTKTFSEFYSSTHFDKRSVYVNVSNRYYLEDDDAAALMAFVAEGNTAFIAASVIDSVLLTRINCRQESPEWLSIINQQLFDKATTSLLPDTYSLKDSFSYFYLPFTNYFSSVDHERARVVGYNQQGKPNFIVYFQGKGKLFLHCDARAFSNYFLLTGNNHLYLKQAMQLLEEKPGNIFWDDYYNKINYREGGGKSFSTLSAIMQHPALAMAFWIAVALLLCYIIFGGKRKQRIVPEIPPVQNTTVAFAEAVAGVYLAERDNKNIAEKMISHFNEFVRSNYFINVHTHNADFVSVLSKKSGVALEQVQLLFAAIRQASQAFDVSDEELMALNEQIQDFYKKRT